MKYLNSQPFSVNGTGKVMEGTCERCVFGEGDHSEDCYLNESGLVADSGPTTSDHPAR